MSQLGQTEKNSARAYVFRFALELGHRRPARHVRKVPEPDLSQTARRFAILANAAAGDKPRSWLAAKIAGAFSFARRRCLVATGGGACGDPSGRRSPRAARRKSPPGRQVRA